MASSINKYAQNVARARYQTQGGTRSVPVSGRTGATIDPSLFAGKTAAPKGAPLQSRPIEGGPALPSPKAYNPIIDAESGEDPNAPRVETQQPITQPGFDPRYMIQGGGPRIDLSGFFPERANTSYDPSKAIGGENVPYKPAGFFRSFLGDPANRKNIESQQAQGAKWEAEAAGEKERANKMADRLTEIKALDEGPAARFAATEKRLADEQKRLIDKEINDEIERNNAIDLGLLQAGNEAVLKDADMVLREKADAAKQALEARRVALAEDAYNNPAQQAVHDPKGNVLFYNPKTGRPTGTFRQPNFGMVTDPNDPTKQILGTTAGGYEGIGPSGSANEPQVTGFGDSYVNGLDASGNKFGKLPPPPKPAPAPASAMTPPRSADTSPMAEASLLGRFKQAMPSLNLERSPGPGVQSPYLSEGEMGQRVMEQIAYPLRAAVADEAKGEFENPQAAFSVLSRPPMFRLKRPDSMEMQQARKAADILRQMYAE